MKPTFIQKLRDDPFYQLEIISTLLIYALISGLPAAILIRHFIAPPY